MARKKTPKDKGEKLSRAERRAARKAEKQAEQVRLEGMKVAKPGLGPWLRARFFAGMVLAAPIAITVWITYQFITFVDKQIKPLVPPEWNPETYTDFAIPGFGVLVAVIFLILLGTIATNLIGRSLLKAGERVINSVPYVRSIYSAIKQIFDTFATANNQNFREVVLIEYPKVGTWCIGFLAASARGEVRTRLATEGKDFVGVFVPTTPNPTSGFLMYVHENELIRLDMTVEEGAKLIISGGLVVPEAPETTMAAAANGPDGAETAPSEETETVPLPVGRDSDSAPDKT
jgi:uncharacterized membrane protein